MAAASYRSVVYKPPRPDLPTPAIIRDNHANPGVVPDIGTLIGCGDDGQCDIDEVCEITETASVTPIGRCSSIRKPSTICVSDVTG